jgi:hypothetical protein
MLLEKQNTDKEGLKKEIYLESSLIELPAQSLTELEKYYYEVTQSNYSNKEDSL